MLYNLNLIVDDYARIEDEYKHVRVEKEYSFMDLEECKTFIGVMVSASKKPTEFKITKTEEVKEWVKD